MAKNNAGGFSFVLDEWGVLDRFLLLGSESGSYYAGAADVTRESVQNIKECIKKDGYRVVHRAIEFSISGRAPKNDPAVVALALAAVYGSTDVADAAYAALPKVARTGTWLFLFVSIIDSLGKWNAAAKRGISRWYSEKTTEALAYQLLKYQTRNNWSHRDVLRLAHVKPSGETQSAIFRFAVSGELDSVGNLPKLLLDFNELKHANSKFDVVRIIENNRSISWEMVPTRWLTDPDVLAALLPTMGLTALLRKLGLLTKYGVIAPLSEGAKLVIQRLSNRELLEKERIHPIAILQALRQYSHGTGFKGKKTWTPVQSVIDALDDAFYFAFSYDEEKEETYLLGVDCSTSMFGARVIGSPNIYAVDVAAVMALAFAKRQKNYWIGGFNTKMAELKISPNMRLDNVISVVRNFKWGGTDCAQPMLHAIENKMTVDKFVVITDNETWYGDTHPSTALVNYRAGFNPMAKLAVVATSVSQFSIIDPADGGSLEIAGFDSAAPQLIAQL